MKMPRHNHAVLRYASLFLFSVPTLPLLTAASYEWHRSDAEKELHVEKRTAACLNLVPGTVLKHDQITPWDKQVTEGKQKNQSSLKNKRRIFHQNIWNGIYKDEINDECECKNPGYPEDNGYFCSRQNLSGHCNKGIACEMIIVMDRPRRRKMKSVKSQSKQNDNFARGFLPQSTFEYSDLGYSSHAFNSPTTMTEQSGHHSTMKPKSKPKKKDTLAQEQQQGRAKNVSRPKGTTNNVDFSAREFNPPIRSPIIAYPSIIVSQRNRPAMKPKPEPKKKDALAQGQQQLGRAANMFLPEESRNRSNLDFSARQFNSPVRSPITVSQHNRPAMKPKSEPKKKDALAQGRQQGRASNINFPEDTRNGSNLDFSARQFNSPIRSPIVAYPLITASQHNRSAMKPKSKLKQRASLTQLQQGRAANGLLPEKKGGHSDEDVSIGQFSSPALSPTRKHPLITVSQRNRPAMKPKSEPKGKDTLAQGQQQGRAANTFLPEVTSFSSDYAREFSSTQSLIATDHMHTESKDKSSAIKPRSQKTSKHWDENIFARQFYPATLSPIATYPLINTSKGNGSARSKQRAKFAQGLQQGRTGKMRDDENEKQAKGHVLNQNRDQYLYINSQSSGSFSESQNHYPVSVPWQREDEQNWYASKMGKNKSNSNEFQVQNQYPFSVPWHSRYTPNWDTSQEGKSKSKTNLFQTQYPVSIPGNKSKSKSNEFQNQYPVSGPRKKSKSKTNEFINQYPISIPKKNSKSKTNEFQNQYPFSVPWQIKYTSNWDPSQKRESKSNSNKFQNQYPFSVPSQSRYTPNWNTSQKGNSKSTSNLFQNQYPVSIPGKKSKSKSNEFQNQYPVSGPGKKSKSKLNEFQNEYPVSISGKKSKSTSNEFQSQYPVSISGKKSKSKSNQLQNQYPVSISGKKSKSNKFQNQYLVNIPKEKFKSKSEVKGISHQYSKTTTLFQTSKKSKKRNDHTLDQEKHILFAKGTMFPATQNDEQSWKRANRAEKGYNEIKLAGKAEEMNVAKALKTKRAPVVQKREVGFRRRAPSMMPIRMRQTQRPFRTIERIRPRAAAKSRKSKLVIEYQNVKTSAAVRRPIQDRKTDWKREDNTIDARLVVLPRRGEVEKDTQIHTLVHDSDDGKGKALKGSRIEKTTYRSVSDVSAQDKGIHDGNGKALIGSRIEKTAHRKGRGY